ncbi:MAG TPA: hypothetical protein VI643_04125 [Planctomycetota bacterium]|nr:hypothetical protein [Planctomycetota bacterium]
MRLAFAGLLVVTASCCLFGNGGDRPPIKTVKAGNAIVATFEEIAKLTETSKDLDQAFVAADLYRRAFDLRAAAAYPALSQEYRIRIEKFKPLFEEPNGRLILDKCAGLLFFVVLESADPILRSAALKRLSMLLTEKCQRPPLRSAPTGTGAPELRERLLQAVYRLLACAVAREYDAAAEGESMLAPMILVYGDALARLAESPFLKPEFAEIVTRLRQTLLADPSKLPEVRVEYPTDRLLGEAVVQRDRAVVQRAPGGSPEAAFTSFVNSLAYFVLASELSDGSGRKRPEFENMPLILNELELMIQKTE